ncbi:MAG: calcium-binding protein, partial [Candidatus Thiodiazotropha sp.]
MTTTYLNNKNSEEYHQEAFSYIGDNSLNINESASVVGISGGAIAGAMAEENSAYDWKDQVLDRYAVMKIGAQISPSAIALFKLALDQGIEQANEWLMTYVQDVVIGNSHESWKADYEAVQSDENPDALDKFFHPTLIDAGHGNIKIATAIRLVNEYAGVYPELGLDIYLNDYGQLVNHLMDRDNPITSRLYGLYLKEAAEWYQTNGAYGEQWDSLPKTFRDALLITYTNIGEKGMADAKVRLYDNRNLPYEPQPGLTVSGGISHLINAQTIGTNIGLNGYGDDVIGVQDMVQHALLDDDVGMASRYALYRLRYVAVSELDYSEYNTQGQLDLYSPITQQGEMTQAYLEDRAAFLNALLASYLNDDASVNGNNLIEFKDEATGQFIMINAADDHVSQRFFFGDGEDDNFTGGKDRDRYYGGGGDDEIDGREGHDYIEGNAGIDLLDGGAGNGELRGGSGDDARIHNAGLYGREGDDALYGEAGNDTLDGGIGLD